MIGLSVAFDAVCNLITGNAVRARRSVTYIEHNAGVGQTKSGIVVGEGKVVTFLERFEGALLDNANRRTTYSPVSSKVFK